MGCIIDSGEYFTATGVKAVNVETEFVLTRDCFLVACLIHLDYHIHPCVVMLLLPASELHLEMYKTVDFHIVMYIHI